MSPIFKGSRKVAGVSAEDLAAQAGALDTALRTGGRQLDDGLVGQAGQLVAKVAERTSIAGNHTVVALAGATGSGKSSLFNAVVGQQVATIGTRRPTTAHPTAAVWGSQSATQLLDWLDVPARHHVTQPPGDTLGSLDGLVLLDLPDFDSRVQSHRVEAGRVLKLVDVFVWVTDPQKYADALLHEDYVQALSTHDAVTIVVLNQIDRLSPEAAAACREDLRRLLADDGMPGVQVLATSVATGQGIPELTQRLANAVAGAGAARQRLSADVVSVANRLRTGVADVEHRVPGEADSELVDALCRAAGTPLVVRAVADDFRREAAGAGGWLFTRWLSGFSADPLARIGLDRISAGVKGAQESDVRAVLGRSSIPPATPAARAAVALATGRLADRAAQGLPQRWAAEVHQVADPGDAAIADALDQAILTPPLRDRNPSWWNLMSGLQWVLGAATVVGLLWLLVIGVLGWLQLPPLPTPTVQQIPVPTLLLVVGLLGGLGLAALSRTLASIGARRRAAVVDRRLRESVARVARELIADPVGQVLDRHRRTRELLDRAVRASGSDRGGPRGAS